MVKVGIHILFLIFGRRLSIFYHWVWYYLCFFHKCYLSYWGSTFLLVIFWEILLLNNVEFCQMPLVYQLMIQCLSFFFFLLQSVIWCTNWFPYVEPLLLSWNQFHFLIIWFASILLRILHLYSWGILVCNYLSCDIFVWLW